MADAECSAAGVEEYRSCGQGGQSPRTPKPTVLSQEYWENRAEGLGAGGGDVPHAKGEGLQEGVREREAAQSRPECGSSIPHAQGAEDRRLFKRAVPADAGTGCEPLADAPCGNTRRTNEWRPCWSCEFGTYEEETQKYGG